jgi:xylulokinase
MASSENAGFCVGLDVGTQSTKGVLLDVAKQGADAVVARASQAYDLIPGLAAGAAEQHPETWRAAVRVVLAALLRRIEPKRVRAIGVSAQQHGLVVLDQDDAVIRPAKLWCDTTTTREADEITQRGQRAVPTGYTLPKLLWMKRHEPRNFERVRHVLLPHDYINFVLSGSKFMEAGDASGTGAFDPVRRVFDEKLLGWIDSRAPRWFPELVAADQPAATVSLAAAEEFGLPAGALIAPGGGDNMMSAIGSGATRPGVTVVSLGTSGTVFAQATRPVIDPNGLVAAFCDSTGAWLPLLCTMNVTGVADEVRRAFGLDYSVITALASAVPAGAGGLTLLPYLVGERVPNLPYASGALLGIRPGALTAGHLFRAALEGTTLGLAAGVERMQRLGLAIDSVRLVGGGAKNALWRQILCDVLGVTVAMPIEAESAALGAALQACWVGRRAAGELISIDAVARPFIALAAEVVIPDAGNAQLYRTRLAEFHSLTERLFDGG